MAKIYVSSTYLDLQEFREKILFHLHKMKQAVTAMEYYLADDRRPADKCIADVEMCGIYVGIFAWRYGTIPDDNNPDKLSITEMEYQTARKKGIPCLIFLHDGKSPWSPDLVDDDKTRIKAFRKKAEVEQTAQWFKNSDELASLVGASLYDKLIALGYGAPEKGVTTFDLEKYYTALRKRYGVLALEGLTPPQKEEYLQIQLRAVFVEQNVRENPPPVELPKEVWEKLSRDKEIHPDDLPSGITLDDVRKARAAYYEKPSHPVLDVLTDSRHQHTIILGDPGSGKSTLARYVMLSLIDPTPTPALPRSETLRTWEGALPLLIELRSYAGLCADDKCNSFLEFLEYLGKTEGWALTQSALHNHLKNDGRAIVIFDGLDEIFDPEQRERITRQIVGFCGDYPKARVIVTSRVIGYRRKILTDAGFTHFTLQDLDEKQVETFVSRWYDLAMSDRPDEAQERRERILRSFKESASIRQLAGNPMLLTIMAIIGKHQELPRERWKLYDHAASVLIQHWDVNKHLKDVRIDADFIGEDDKKELLRRLAFRMQGGDGGLAGNYIHREHLQEEFESYLKERYSQAPDRAKVIAEAMIQQFRERNFILSLYGANLYGFVHRAFLEYFCASAFVYKFEKTKELTIEQLKTDVYGKHWEDQSWHEVLRLICGMIDERWVGEIITYLAVKELDRSITPWNITLAIQCLNEVRNVVSIEESAGILLESAYKCAIWFARNIYHTNSQSNWDFGSQLFYSIGSIGTKWPQRIKMRTRLENLLSKTDSDGDIRQTAVLLLCLLFGDDPKVRQVLADLVVNDKDKSVRDVTVGLFAEYFRHDIETLPILRDWVVSSRHPEVRSSAVDTLGRFFPEDTQTLPLLREWAVSSQYPEVRSRAVYALGEYFRDDVQTLPLLYEWALSQDPEVRSSVVSALGRFFPEDTRTLPLLYDYAVNDVSGEVRSSAVFILGRFFPEDTRTLPLLRDRAANDALGEVRSDAVRALGNYFHDDAQTLPLLREWAVSSQYPEVRSVAVSTLGRFFREDIQTLPLLREWAVSSQYPEVRAMATFTIAQYFLYEQQTLPFLGERAVNDESPATDDLHDKYYPREAAIEAIASNWPTHPDTLPLLRERAQNDPTPWLREHAKELADKIEAKGKKE